MFNILSKNPHFTFHTYDRTKINMTVHHVERKLAKNGLTTEKIKEVY